MANSLETELISLTLPIDWLKKIDKKVEKHEYGATSRQDIIRAILSSELSKED